MKPPTYKAFIPTPPAETEYLTMVELFFNEAAYVAKFLWRDDMVAAKYILDHTMKQEDLIPMLVWHLESEHNWSVKTGPYGRRLKKWLRGDLWADLERTYCGAGVEENWQALDRSIELFHRTAIEVGGRLGYTYPYDLDRRAVAYLQRVRQLDPDAESFA